MEYVLAGKEDIMQLVDMRILYFLYEQGEVSKEYKDRLSETLPLYFEKHLGNDLFAFAAKENGSIVATAFLLVIEKPANPHFINGRIGEVLNVCTRKEYQKRGIATKLMRMLTDMGRKQGLDYIELQATQEGVPVYKKCGFQEEVNRYVSMTYHAE